MKSTEFVQKLQENIGTPTLPIFNMMSEVLPSDTIHMSYELYAKMLYHSAFYKLFQSFNWGEPSQVIESVIPGRVMLFKTGHLIVVV